MPRRSYAEIGEPHGLTKAQVLNAKTDGVNVYDDAALAEWKRQRRPKADTGATLSAGSGDDITIEELEREVRRADDYNTVKILKEKIASLHQAQKMRREDRELIPLKEAKEAVIRIVSGLKGRLLKVPSDTAPRVEGLEAAKAEKVIREEIIKAMEDLADDSQQIFEGS